jgi:hypothetical protein
MPIQNGSIGPRLQRALSAGRERRPQFGGWETAEQVQLDPIQRAFRMQESELRLIL